MKTNFRTLFSFTILAFVIMVTQSSCKTTHSTDLTKTNIIPKPQTVIANGGSFEVTNETKIYTSFDLIGEAAFLANYFQTICGINVEIVTDEPTPEDGNILLVLSDKLFHYEQEGYELIINEDRIILGANKAAGIFYGVQTLGQILSFEEPELIDSQKQVSIPTGTVRDYPRYKHRGSMLDVSRHFFDVEEVKTYINYLAMYKVNVLHLHLSDDQGWRIEIKSWPKLTEIGGSTEVGGGEGGFFTQEQFKEIVAYARDRDITIIPEIEVPGHSNAALASYPELNCDGKSPELYTGTDVGFSTVCTSKEITYKFVDDVIRELSSISPANYIHIGGDESLSTEKDDYIFFINKVQDIVNKRGKQMIGWEEIVQADLNAGSVVQFWANEEHALEAVQKGNQLIMSPAKRIYLDMKYDSTSPLGLSWAAYIEVDDAYNWDPSAYTKGISDEYILGIEAPLWTETVETMDDIRFMLFPRMPAYAEIGWSLQENRNWDNFKNRLANHSIIYNRLGINYYPSSKIEWVK